MFRTAVVVLMALAFLWLLIGPAVEEPIGDGISYDTALVVARTGLSGVRLGILESDRSLMGEMRIAVGEKRIRPDWEYRRRIMGELEFVADLPPAPIGETVRIEAPASARWELLYDPPDRERWEVLGQRLTVWRPAPLVGLALLAMVMAPWAAALLLQAAMEEERKPPGGST